MTPKNDPSSDVELTTITPEMALQWLSAVPEYQRKLDDNQVKKLALAIRKNEWRENGATIVFDEDGNLLDGQHRLHAISISGKPVKSLVVNGILGGEDTFQTIGDEKPRRAVDFIQGKYATTTIAVTRFLWHYRNKTWPIPGESGITIPTVDLLKVGKPHFEYIASLVEPSKPTGKITKQIAFCVFLLFFYTKIEADYARQITEFIARVGDGVELPATSPAYQLRSKFLSLQQGARIPRQISRHLISKAVLAHFEKKPMSAQMLKVTNTEEYPVLPGFDFKKR